MATAYTIDGYPLVTGGVARECIGEIMTGN